MSSTGNTMDWSSLEPDTVDRIWDAMNRQIVPIGGRVPTPSTQVADTIRLLEQRDDAPQLSLPQQDFIWTAVSAATFAGPAVASPGLYTQVAEAGPHGHPLLRHLLELAQSAVRLAAIGAIAGALMGMLIFGAGSRVLMRIAAMLSDAQRQGAITENGNAVGEVTLDGTLALLFFVGVLFGTVAGIAVMAVRPWLPASGPLRYLVTGAIGFAIAGPIVLEGGENADYRRFGILGLNVCLFTALPFIFGVAVLPVIDWLDRRISNDLPGVAHGWGDVPKSVALIVLALPVISLVSSVLALQPLGLLLLLPLIRVLAPVWARHAPTFEERRRRELRSTRIGYAALAVPCLLGLVLMAQSIARLI